MDYLKVDGWELKEFFVVILGVEAVMILFHKKLIVAQSATADQSESNNL